MEEVVGSSPIGSTRFDRILILFYHTKMDKRLILALPLATACHLGPDHPSENLWDSSQCDSPPTQQYWDGSDKIRCIRDLSSDIAYANEELGVSQSFIGPEAFEVSAKTRREVATAIDGHYENLRALYPSNEDPVAHWMIDLSEQPVQRMSDEYFDGIEELVLNRYFYPFDVNSDGVIDGKDDLNGDNRITKEDWEAHKSQKE